MKQLILLATVILLLSAHRLPAPIVESPESPTPAASARPTAKPKSKPKATASPNDAAKNDTKQKPALKTTRFAGKWIGVMPEVPWGNVPTELTVDQAESTMHWQESGKEKGLAKATIVNGDTLQANFMVGVAETWSITPTGDGAIARVRLQAFMNDQTAIFHRVVRQ